VSNAKPRRGGYSPLRLGFALSALLMSFEVPGGNPPPTVNPADIRCQLAMPTRLSRSQPAVLTLMLNNQSRQTLQLLKRNTPLEGWLADSLIVERDDQAVPYSGAMAKRLPAMASEYLRLKPGASHRHRVALQQGYDVSQPGSYRVRWRGDLMDAFLGNGAPDADRLSPQTLDCAAILFVRSA
jgi:hypothetical protein